MLCLDIYSIICEFLNLNDLKSLLTTSEELSIAARKTTHYKECISYGAIKINSINLPIQVGNIYICKYIFRMTGEIGLPWRLAHDVAIEAEQRDIAAWLLSVKNRRNKN